MSISLSDVATDYTWVDYVYGGPRLYGYITSSLAGGFRSIKGYLTVITASVNHFYIRIPRSLLPTLSVIPSSTSRVYSPWNSFYHTPTVYATWNDYNVYRPTDGHGHVIYYDSTYIYVQFWQEQLAQGNSFPRAGLPPFYFEMICSV